MFLKEKIDTVYRSRLLISNLVSRDLKARYRGSTLGFLLSFLNPLLLMLVYTLAFGVILKPRFPIPHMETASGYSLFLFSGLLSWIWFSTSILECSSVLSTQGSLIKKVFFPVEILPITTVTTNFINFLLGLPILILFFLILGQPLTPFVLLIFPVMIVQFLFTLGLGFFAAALTVHFKDIGNIIANLMTLWFFATPVIYPFEFGPILSTPWIRTLLLLNPMTHIIEAYQFCFFFGSLLHYKKLLVTLVVSLLVFLGGYYFFDRVKDTFPEQV